MSLKVKVVPAVRDKVFKFAIMKNFMFFYGLVFLQCLIHVSEANFFVLSSNWTVVNNSSLTTYKTVQGPFRAIVDGDGNPIVSENYKFGLGFINVNSSGKFALSVIMGVNFTSPPGMEIWTANRGRMVAEGAILKLGTSGNLILMDTDGTVAWTINRTGNKAIAMQNNGNLVIYNTTNSSALSSSDILWQSWDHPTHTLVPGQVLKTGTTLVSNASAFSSSEGIYKLVMKPGGLVLYYAGSSGSDPEPYWSLGISGLNYEGILRPCFYNSSLGALGSEASYTGQQLVVSYNGSFSNSSCSKEFSNKTGLWFLAPNHNDTVYRFLRLDDDGSLRAYRIAPVPGSTTITNWSPDNELDASNKNCILPEACGPYGICVKGQCTCPGSGTNDNFQQIKPLDVTQGCYSKSGDVECNQSNTISDQHFLPLDGFDYFPNDFLQPQQNITTIDECKDLCSSNCSCMAAFFRNSSTSCFLAGKPLLSLKSAPNQTYKAYIKVLNSRPFNQSSSASSGPLSGASIAGITVGSVAALLFLCLIVIMFVQHRRKHKNNVVDTEEEEIDPQEVEEEAFLKTLPGLPPRFTYHELKDATDGFSRKLGTGGFGSVYEGVLKDDAKVAVKKLDGPRQGYKEFRAEVATIGSISHLNLVRLRGFCADSRQRLLVYELLENGSLDKWLFPPKSTVTDQNDNSTFLTWEQRYNVAVGTARGLTYLHEECRESIMHLDIKPQNILLDKNFSPKVSDFGMSKLLNENMTQIVTAVRGTPGYLAPEWLRHSIATKKCDVYSFGMVLLELVSGRRNFDPSASDPRLCYFPAWAMLRALEGRYLELVDYRLGNNVDHEAVIRVTKVAFWCIQDDPNKRPWMSVALKMLEGEWDIPDAPMWLLQRGPQFLEGYGYERMDRVEEVLLGMANGCDSVPTMSATDISGPR